MSVEVGRRLRLKDCQIGDKVVIRGGLHPTVLARYGFAEGDHAVSVSPPLAGGIGVNVLDEFTLEPVRDPDSFTIADPDAEVVEILERTKYPKVKRDSGDERGVDDVDPLRAREKILT